MKNYKGWSIDDALQSLVYDPETGEFSAGTGLGSRLFGTAGTLRDAQRYVRRSIRADVAHQAAMNRIRRWVATQYAGSLNRRKDPLARLWRQAVHRAFVRAGKRTPDGPRYWSRWAASCKEIIAESRKNWNF